MRLNFRSTTCASVWISSVFARPGTPMIRLLPPTKSVCSTSSMTSCWPMIRLWSSARIALRPAFMRSARAMSSGESRSMLVATLVSSVCERVDDVVHAELIRFVGIADRRKARIRIFPVFRDVVVVVRDCEQPLRRVVVLEQTVEDRPEAAVVRRQEVVGRRNLEERVEDLVRAVELFPPGAGNHA